MKIHILSDLHLEFSPFEIPKIEADIVVLAGDINVGEKGVAWAIKNFPSKPVLYILGNHEYYGGAYPKLVQKVKHLATGTNVVVLENDVFRLENTVFLGCTLWTDFELYGDYKFACYQASQKLNDFRKIRISPKYSKATVLDLITIHKKSLNWLQRNLIEVGEGLNLIVITHHAPSKKSIPFVYAEDILSAAYASDLDSLIENSNIKLWIHGHTHTQLDYKVGETRVVCNPRGYPDEPNLDFKAEMIIDF